jgi:SHS family lactate transporter-like MFS transporter
MLTPAAAQTSSRANARYAVAAGFLGWTIDAFDFFVLVFTIPAIAQEFGRPIPSVALTLTASLVMRPIGAFVFGLMADRFGRKPVLMANILFFSAMEVLSGLAGTFAVFFALRLLYGVGMGGNWGVGASLALESAPSKNRGIVSGLLQEGYAFGNLLAALAYYLIFPHWGWRSMFFIGAAPAMITLLICTRVQETKAWRESRVDWSAYRRSIFRNRKIFLYLVGLTTMMTFISHGTQDLYPTFLERQKHYSVDVTALVTAISLIGAIIGGLTFAHFSDRWGRRLTMVLSVLLATAAIPLWVLPSGVVLIIAGGFMMQMMVQGAWGVIPAHLNELSPAESRGFFPGLAYQLGVVVSSGAGYFEALLGERYGYGASMASFAAVALLSGAVVIWLGPESKGVSFSREETPG